MSLRSEVVRLGLRWLIKCRSNRELSIEQHRQLAIAAERFVRDPPAETETLRVDADGVWADLITTPASEPHRHVLFLHGGGFIIGSPSLYRHVTWRIAETTCARVLAVDYRLAPEHPFPAAQEDAVRAYRWLLGNRADPGRTAVVGGLARGGLVFSLSRRLRDAGVAPPRA